MQSLELKWRGIKVHYQDKSLQEPAVNILDEEGGEKTHTDSLENSITSFDEEVGVLLTPWLYFLYFSFDSWLSKALLVNVISERSVKKRRWIKAMKGVSSGLASWPWSSSSQAARHEEGTREEEEEKEKSIDSLLL